jgi:hypothetical protein
MAQARESILLLWRQWRVRTGFEILIFLAPHCFKFL